MPHFDARSGEVVMRIVYDGEPESGKTTNVTSLTSQIGLTRRGSLESPGTAGRRTEYFDWFDFSGGCIDGKRVRCQLVSVPGQPELLRRRRYLLESADAVVYVADSRPAHLQQITEDLARTRRSLNGLGRSNEVGLVVQANKQDLPGALSPGDLARALQLATDIAVLPATASNGEGVVRTFTLAACLATERVRALLAGTKFATEVVHDSPSELYRALLSLEESSLQPELAKARIGNILPVPIESLAEDVFPPVRGRSLLSRADTSSLSAPDVPCPWAPPRAVELKTAAGLIFHSAEDWCYEQAGAARRRLLELVERHRAWAELAYPGRALFILTDASRASFRIWSLTAPATSLTEWISQQLQQRDAAGIDAGCRLLQAFERRALELSRRAELATLAIAGGTIASLALDDGAKLSRTPGQLLAALAEYARGYAARDPELGSWLAARPSLFVP